MSLFVICFTNYITRTVHAILPALLYKSSVFDPLSNNDEQGPRETTEYYVTEQPLITQGYFFQKLNKKVLNNIHLSSVTQQTTEQPFIQPVTLPVSLRSNVHHETISPYHAEINGSHVYIGRKSTMQQLSTQPSLMQDSWSSLLRMSRIPTYENHVLNHTDISVLNLSTFMCTIPISAT